MKDSDWFKIDLSSNGDKRMQSIDSIAIYGTFAYGAKEDLVNKKKKRLIVEI